MELGAVGLKIYDTRRRRPLLHTYSSHSLCFLFLSEPSIVFYTENEPMTCVMAPTILLTELMTGTNLPYRSTWYRVLQSLLHVALFFRELNMLERLSYTRALVH